MSAGYTTPEAFIGEMKPLRPEEHASKQRRSGSEVRREAYENRKLFEA